MPGIKVVAITRSSDELLRDKGLGIHVPGPLFTHARLASAEVEQVSELVFFSSQVRFRLVC